MSLRIVLAASAVPLLLSGCIGGFISALSPHAPNAPTPAPVSSGSALFTETRTWTYALTSVEKGETRRGTYGISVVKVDGDKVLARLSTHYPGDGPAQELTVVGKRYAKVPFAPWAPTIAFADFEVPEAQANPTRESVTVPAGTFMADRYEFDVPSLRSCCLDQGHVTMWLAGGYGMVKQIGTLKRGEPDAGEYQATLELERVTTY